MNPDLRICKGCQFYFYNPEIAPWHRCRVKRREYKVGEVGGGHKSTFAEDRASGIFFGIQKKREEPPWDYYFVNEDFGIPKFCPHYMEQLMANQKFEVDK